jgi:hypothetical protein
LFKTGPAVSGAKEAASPFHALASDLDNRVRRLEEAAYLGSEARLKYGLPVGEKGERVPEEEDEQA